MIIIVSLFFLVVLLIGLYCHRMLVYLGIQERIWQMKTLDPSSPQLWLAVLIICMYIFLVPGINLVYFIHWMMPTCSGKTVETRWMRFLVEHTISTEVMITGMGCLDLTREWNRLRLVFVCFQTFGQTSIDSLIIHYQLQFFREYQKRIGCFTSRCLKKLLWMWRATLEIKLRRHRAGLV